MANSSTKSKLNWLRAAVLGANDGIVSIAGLVVGVAGATQSSSIILTAGIAGLVAGAFSMAVGEYISVSTQRDAEKAYINKEKLELEADPAGELEELAMIYQQKGLTKETAHLVAVELSEKDVLAAHLEVEFGLSQDELTNAWHAAYASAISFTIGGLIPVLVITLTPSGIRVPLTFISVAIALIITGYVSAKLSNVSTRKAMIRVLLGGMLAMIATYAVGYLFGTSII